MKSIHTSLLIFITISALTILISFAQATAVIPVDESGSRMFGFKISDTATIVQDTILEGKLTKGLSVTATFMAQKNSPLLFSFSQMDCLYSATIYGRGNQKLFFRNNTKGAKSSFTAPETGIYKLELKGIGGTGRYKVGLEPYTIDAELNRKENVLNHDDSILGRIAVNAVATYRFSGQKNSPVLITFNQNDCYYIATIHDKIGQRLLFKDKKSTGPHAFTPPVTGEYIIELKGVQGVGEYSIGIVQYTSDAELNSNENVLSDNGSASGRIAMNAIATYRFSGQINSPLILTFDTKDCSYDVTIFGNDHRKLATILISSTGVYPFTPPENGRYTIELKGTHGAGFYSIGLEQFTSDAELSSKDNILELDGSLTGRIATKAVATYRFTAQKDSHLFLSFTLEQCAFGAAIYGVGGRKLLSKNDIEEGNYSFTPPETGTYIIKLTGTKGAGSYSIGLSGL